RPAEGRQLDRVRAGAGQDPLVAEALLPEDRGGAAKVIQVIHLAIPADADAVGDGVLAMEPARRAARHGWLLREVVAGVAEVAAGVVDPGAAVLPGCPALERDTHRDLHIR